MNIVIHSPEPLVFRDGRPFGDAGHVNGGSLRWPWASTVVGMLRNRIGLSRDNKYFDAKDNNRIPPEKIAAMQEIKAVRIQPLWQKQTESSAWQYLYPAPADALLVQSTPESTSEEIKYTVHGFSYENPFKNGGVDLPWKNWLIPLTETMEKPCRDSPELWHQATFFSWLKDGSLKKVTAKKLGVSLPRTDLRLHTAIDVKTGTVREGQLFSTQGICLHQFATTNQEAGRLGIGVELSDIKNGDNPYGPCYLGAERKTAFVEEMPEPFPNCPDWFKNAQFLKIILLTNGDFGSWAPSWLLPDPKADETQWSQVPGSDIQVRICSSFIPRWQPVSGWDYDKKGPKATSKLVPAGAVYLLEIKDPGRSQEFAELIWGKSMADNLSHPNGCGAVCVGNVSL